MSPIHDPTRMFEELFFLYYGLTFVFVMWMGWKQSHEEEGKQTFENAAVVALIGQAAVTFSLLGWTGWFGLGVLWLAITLLCHHAIVHWNSKFEGETCSCAPFQCKDVRNHETWVVACVVACLVSVLRI